MAKRKRIEFDYWATLAADPRYQDNHAPRILDVKDAPSLTQFERARRPYGGRRPRPPKPAKK